MASQNRKKKRQIEYLPNVKRYYIFCEGKKTEPFYFEGFKKAIAQNPIYQNSVFIMPIGVGAETLRVVDAARDYVEGKKLKYADIWCVYDKDSFPSADFNQAEEKIKQLSDSSYSIQNGISYFSAWSNQCIEYWFILHFNSYTSDNDRKYYREFLHKKFQELGWIRYEKNNEELFDILTNKGNPKLAITFAKKQSENFAGKTPAESAPATKVHLLVEELAQYLPPEIRARYVRDHSMHRNIGDSPS